IYDYDGPRNVANDFDFQDILIADWEYDPAFKIPLIRSEGAGISSSPQNFVPPQTRKILLHAATLGLVRATASRRSSIKGAQETFPDNLTIDKEEQDPGSSRSDEFFVDAVLNGFAPALMTEGPVGTYHVRYNLDQYVCDDKHQAPSVHMTLRKNSAGALMPEQIEYQIREKGSNPAVFGPTIIAKSAEGGPQWEAAKAYFRIAEFIDGQVKGHLGRAHINTGQYAIALYRNLQKSPILRLLHPHLKGVSAINTFGKGIIFGNEGILVLSPLTETSLIDAMRDDLGQCNWKGWSPRSEITATGQHYYAKIQHLYWDLIKEYINHFFSIHETKIKLDWKEIYTFSQDLVEHSVPFFSYPLEPGETWYDESEINVESFDTNHAISAITQVRTNPSARDIENLKQVCAYAIYHATIWHAWRNDNQANYGGEIDYARLALDYEVDEAAFQLFIVNILVQVKHGYLTKNEENDIPAKFVALLKDQAETFKGAGYDVRKIRSRINI
ncbi:MAG: lipoxygenase family protein, partial [Thermosynechococcaceae cyanobacterium]